MYPVASAVPVSRSSGVSKVSFSQSSSGFSPLALNSAYAQPFSTIFPSSFVRFTFAYTAVPFAICT